MTLQEFYSYQEQTFDSYAKTIIRNEAKNVENEYARRGRKETQLSALTPNELEQLSYEDTYDLDSMVFQINGYSIKVNDPYLGQALYSLTPQRRDIILRCYFLGQTDPQIGVHMNLSPSKVNYRRNAALKILRSMLEGLDYGQ